MPALKRAVLALGLLITACGLTRGNGSSGADDGVTSSGGSDADGAGASASASQNTAGRAFTDGEGASATGAVGGGGAAGAGAPDQPAAAAGSSSAPLDADEAVCDGYVAAWLAREAEYVSGQTSCLECLGYNPDCEVARRAVTEGQDGCFHRHCLCDAADPGCEVRAGACACFGRCLPNPPAPVRQAWFDYMACEVEHCATACR